MITHKLPFGNFTIHDRYMIGEFMEGVNFDLPMLDTLTSIAQEHFTRPFGYVANRIHSYSIDPKLYRELDRVPLMQAMAIVTYRTATWQALQVERGFMPKMPVGVFFDLTAALSWVETALDKQPSPPQSRTQRQ
ncbi:hypothetical protein [Ruficoccus sp. ZRK36]|uniref:hypothetical protein n=1 Tax=Ruficoccus sp. ZRK36 TaxID=2866311 RepID=UPI001C7309A0|nr:hypothetical protein [Ruficoccus sp. ZRK36]QYY36546.1 hypothetical protein K0V07_03525 [Ruficoccus sp. ZRK36]